MPPRRFPSRSALANIASRRSSLSLTAPNINHLVRVFLLDGSSKVLQMTAASTVEDVLTQMKFNMDLADISTCALFRVVDGHGARRMELTENMKESMKDIHEAGPSSMDLSLSSLPSSHSPRLAEGELPTVRILFRSWIYAKCGVFERDVFQDLDRHKSHNSALWLAYMEANFMCMTGRYYLSDDEAILLGCLRMQADSGDFNPNVHSIENIKLRVCHQFPRPISTQMRALMSPTLIGNGMADALAERIMFLYARIAGKHKAEAQIEFLQTLRTWCPFFGASFFTVQCQYDDGASEEEPPVSTMNVAIGPLAIFIITQTEPLIILRHPYKRIVKWIAYRDKHIFCYWAVKPGMTLKDIEEKQQKDMMLAQAAGRIYKPETDFDATPYCDCIYLVTPSCAELEYLVRSYVAMLKADTMPKLRGATGELLPPEPNELMFGNLAEKLGVKLNSDCSMGAGTGTGTGTGTADNNNNVVATPFASKEEKKVTPPPARRKSRFGALFSALGGFGGSESPTQPDSSSSSSHDDTATGTSKKDDNESGTFPSYISGGSGIGSDSGSDEDKAGGGGAGSRSGGGYGDDCAGVKNSLFRNVYTPTIRRRSLKAGAITATGAHMVYDDNDDEGIPSQIQFAASMSELQRLTSEKFSDSEGEESNAEDSGNDSSSGDDDGGISSDNDENGNGGGSTSRGGSVKSTSSSGSGRRSSVKITTESAFSRVKGILFGGAAPKSTDKGLGTGSEIDGEDDVEDENSGSEYESSDDSD